MAVILEITLYELIIIILTIIGGFFALYQWRQLYKLKRSELIKEAIDKTRNNPDVVHVLYSIDYGDKWYGFDFISNHDEELKYDRAFALFDYLCYMRLKGIFGRDEFKIFEYRIQRMASNSSFMEYFFNLYHFSKLQNAEFSFYHLLKYMKKKRLIEQEFWNINSEKYDKFLNI